MEPLLYSQTYSPSDFMSKQQNQNSKKSQVGNRKAGSRNNNVMSKKQFQAQSPQKRQELMFGPRVGQSVSESRALKQLNPTERSGRNGTRTIIYKEYVQDILGSVNFATVTFACNPGLSNLFAWLSGQALFYQEYTVKRLKFCYETEKAKTLSGKVMFAFLQDSSDPAPASKQEMLENLLKAANAIYEPFCLPISMTNFPALGKSRFIRSGVLAANLDVKTYDIGQLVVATQGCADTTAIGELYIEYEIELRTPLQSAAQLANAFSSHIVGNTAVTNAAVLGTAPIITGGLDIVAATGGGTSIITFNKVGQYLVLLEMVGTGMNTAQNPTTGTSTVTVVQMPTPFAGGLSNAAANAGTNSSTAWIVTASARGQQFIFNASGTTATVTAGEVRIALYNAALL